jgi:hypothetical protein
VTSHNNISVGIATRLRAGRSGFYVFYSRRGLGIFLFTTASRTALWPTQPPMQWVRGALSPEVKWSGREADHSLPSSAEVKECVELYLHFPITPSWRGAQLKVEGQLYLYFFPHSFQSFSYSSLYDVYSFKNHR